MVSRRCTFGNRTVSLFAELTVFIGALSKDRTLINCPISCVGQLRTILRWPKDGNGRLSQVGPTQVARVSKLIVERYDFE